MNIKELTIIYKEYITKKNVGWTMAKKRGPLKDIFFSEAKIQIVYLLLLLEVKKNF
jgi:hypothetical protein